LSTTSAPLVQHANVATGCHQTKGSTAIVLATFHRERVGTAKKGWLDQLKPYLCACQKYKHV